MPKSHTSVCRFHFGISVCIFEIVEIFNMIYTVLNVYEFEVRLSFYFPWTKQRQTVFSRKSMQARSRRYLLNCEIINAKKDIFKALNPINFLKIAEKKGEARGRKNP